ncbi:MAG: M42 family peptidase [Clostridia bacterium]|nr:M42 family peptidase [Clostridia bacterium]MBR5747098.1 M42 family peptidase [Clostridia bacterium]
MDLQLLKKYCDILGPSGMEDGIRDAIISDIKDSGCEYSVDPMGNMLVFKKGRKRRNKTVLFAAHMDEVGFIVKHIDDEGYLWFGNIGGIDRRVISGRRLKFCRSGITGVVASKAIHMQTKEERGKCEPPEDMNIDIGACTREEALEYVNVGDCAVFAPDFELFGEGLVRSKALDDRFGCAVLVNMINSDLEYDTHFAFNTCEEVGCDGAAQTVFKTRPDVAVIIESTTAGDVLDTPKTNCACEVGGGAVISFMDGATLYDKKAVAYAVETAEKNGIKWQYKNVIAGGNEARSYQRGAAGAKVIAISAPARYIHSASDVLHTGDIDAVEKLAFAINERSFENV